jgi:hypothetical protein
MEFRLDISVLKKCG